jgi:hypothetical protein
MTYSQSPGSAALACPGRGLAILAAHWPTPADLPQFCSCGNLDCPPPPHPIGTLTAADATRDLAQLSRWWLAHPTANLATFTDARIGAIELHHPARAQDVMRLINTHRADQGPIIQAGRGRLVFLVKPTQLHPDQQPTAAGCATDIGKVSVVAPGTLMLLPPGRLMNGERLQWMRRLYHTTSLPDADPLHALLADFLESGTLDDLHPLLTM